MDPADDCTFYYLYYYDEATDNATVWVRKHKDCPPPVPVLAIVLGVIAGIVILGILLLLLWKLLTVLHDRSEYATFNNERLMAKWDTVSDTEQKTYKFIKLSFFRTRTQSTNRPRQHLKIQYTLEKPTK